MSEMTPISRANSSSSIHDHSKNTYIYTYQYCDYQVHYIIIPGPDLMVSRSYDVSKTHLQVVTCTIPVRNENGMTPNKWHMRPLQYYSGAGQMFINSIVFSNKKTITNTLIIRCVECRNFEVVLHAKTAVLMPCSRGL